MDAYHNILDVYVTVHEKMDHVIEELSLSVTHPHE